MMCLAWKGEIILRHPPISVHHLRLGWRSNHSRVENNQLQYRAVGFRWQRRGKGGEGTRIGRGQACAYLQIGEISKLCPLKVKSCVGAQSLRKSCTESSLDPFGYISKLKTEKYYSKIIFKCVNSTVELIFNEKVTEK